MPADPVTPAADEVREGPPEGVWTDAVLRGLRLVGLDVEDWRLIDCRVEGCDLSAARLAGAVLVRVELVDCRMSAADLGNARLEDVRFSGCKVDDVNLRFVNSTRVLFEDCVLSGADLQGAELEGAIFDRCLLAGADLQRCRLRGAVFPGSDLSEVKGVGALRGARLSIGQVASLAPRLAAELGIVIEG